MFSLLLFFFHCIQKKLITPLQYWCFHCCCFFIVFKRNYSSVLDAHPPHPAPAPAHPCFFKLKIVNLFQICQWTDTFVKYSLLLPFFSKKEKQHKEDNINITIFGVPEQALPGGYWGPYLYVILYRLFSYTVLLPIKASGHWKKQPWP